MTDSRPTSERIMQLIMGYWATGILGTAASYSLFTHLEDGATSAAHLADRAGISERGAQALLDGLVGFGVVEVDGSGYRNSAEASAFLVEGRAESLSEFAKLKLGVLGSLSALPEVVRAGGPPAPAAEGVPDRSHWGKLVQVIAPQSVPLARIVAETLRLSEAGEISILDIGGGSGICSGIWLEANPEARSTQLDWEPVNAIARRLLDERGVGDRVSYIDGDLHTTGFGDSAHDLVMYSNVSHQEGPEDNIEVFAKARRALKPGGTLVVSDYVVEDDRSGPPFALTFAPEMLLKTPQGSTWRQADYRDWLTKAGFGDITFQTTPSPTTLIYAR